MLSRDQFANKGDSLIDRYNNDNPIREQLLKYGYKQGSTSDEFISPNSSSGHQVKVFGNIATSLSTSDAGVGVEGNGSHNVDSFGLYRFYECDNDLNTAIQNIAAHYRSVEASNEQVAPVDPLDGFTFSTAQELSQRHFEPIIWLKKGLLPLPNLTLIAGAPKCGKSWFAMGMARDIASEGNVVVYIANEDNERRLKDRYAKISDFASPNLIFISGLSSERPLPKGDAAHDFIRAVKAKYPNLKCIFIDTIQAIRDPKQKDHYGVVEAEFGKLRKLAHELDITIVAVHHTKKKTDFETEPLDDVLGSQAIVATVETILILQRVVGSQDIDLFITGKDVVQQDDYRLCWTDAGFSDPQDRTYASLGPIQQQIVKFVKSQPSCTQTTIVEGVGKSKQQVNEAVNRLIELGIIKLVEGKKLICVHT